MSRKLRREQLMLSWISCGGWTVSLDSAGFCAGPFSAHQGLGSVRDAHVAHSRCVGAVRNQLNLRTAMSRLCSRWATGGRLWPGHCVVLRFVRPNLDTQGQRQHGAQQCVCVRQCVRNRLRAPPAAPFCHFICKMCAIILPSKFFQIQS